MKSRWITLALAVLLLISPPAQAQVLKKPKPVEQPLADRYVFVDLTTQEAHYVQDGFMVWKSVISSGRDNKQTATGIFEISNKHKEWVSTIYKVPMPHFLRLNHSDTGLHAGPMPGFPGSAGCIRLPDQSAADLFSLVDIGTMVIIEGKAHPFEYYKEKILRAQREKKKSAAFSKKGATRPVLRASSD